MWEQVRYAIICIWQGVLDKSECFYDNMVTSKLYVPWHISNRNECLCPSKDTYKNICSKCIVTPWNKKRPKCLWKEACVNELWGVRALEHYTAMNWGSCWLQRAQPGWVSHTWCWAKHQTGEYKMYGFMYVKFKNRLSGGKLHTIVAIEADWCDFSGLLAGRGMRDLSRGWGVFNTLMWVADIHTPMPTHT